MAVSLRRARQAATELAIRQAIAATAALPIGFQRSIVRTLVAVAGGTPLLRSRVRENMRLALGDAVPAQAVSKYFGHLRWVLSNTLATFHYGVAATRIQDEIQFDASVRVLDDAVAEGRGVVLTAPHWHGHELVAAIINRRHPMAMVVRQAPTSERMARKLKWYAALGAEIVLRPKEVSTISDAMAYLKVLRRGKLLAITPDLLADPGEGVQTCLFGRPTTLHGGAFTLSVLAGAPMIRVSALWHSAPGVVVTFDRAAPPPDACDRDAAIRANAQDWCGWFEEKLSANPENWLFWLDRRWSRFLRATAPAPRIG